MISCFLYSYGFAKRHCLEALEVTQGDVGVALEVLLSQYFKLGLAFPFIISNNSINNGDSGESVTNVPSEILQRREEEKCVLEAIYESAFEERIANRLWVLNLRLDYLFDFCCGSHENEKELNNQRQPKKDRDSCCDRVFYKKPKPEPEICRLV
jgi:ATP-dependent RNA helicase DHX57